MAARAVIVGIGSYAEPHWRYIAPPVQNAIAMARWALGAGFAPHDIFLFLSGAEDGAAEDLAQLGVSIQDANQPLIDAFILRDLALTEGSADLFFYWSGHGITHTGGQRLLFCADYTSLVINRVFNASLFLRDLRTEKYACFQRALVLADVCGNYSDNPVRPPAWEPDEQHNAEQMVYFAAPEGDYAVAGTGEGAFSNTALQVLRRFQSFPPDLEQFGRQLNVDLDRSNSPRYRIHHQSRQAEHSRYVGAGRPSADHAGDRLVELLVERDPGDALLRQHYRATAAAIGNPRLLSVVNGATGMVRELNSLQDQTGIPTHGLIQFVLRLCADAALRPVLEDWLNQHARPDAKRREMDRLAVESERKLLIIDVEADLVGNLVAFTPLLRHRDFRKVEVELHGRLPIADWSTLETALAALLRQLEQQSLADDIELHIIAGLELFDRAFHQLAGPNAGRRLGQVFGVALHYRPRFLRRPSPEKRKWIERASPLDTATPATLEWMRIVRDRDLPLEPGLCFASFPVLTGAPPGGGREILSRLLQLGAPYVYWRHDADETDCQEALTRVLRALPTLADMPDRLRDLRIASSTSGWGSLLWDGPAFRPFNI